MDQIKEMAEAPGLEEMQNAVNRTVYAKHYQFRQKIDNFNIEQIYADCLHHLYTVDLRQNPYSLAEINTYFFLKEEELKKLTTAMECVRYSLSHGETLAYIGGKTR